MAELCVNLSACCCFLIFCFLAEICRTRFSHWRDRRKFAKSKKIKNTNLAEWFSDILLGIEFCKWEKHFILFFQLVKSVCYFWCLKFILPSVARQKQIIVRKKKPYFHQKWSNFLYWLLFKYEFFEIIADLCLHRWIRS